MYQGGDLGHAPLWNGLDVWPYELQNEMQLSQGYLTGDTWVWQAKAPFLVPIDVCLSFYTLHAHHPGRGDRL